MRKETLESIVKAQGRGTHSNEARDMAKALLTGKVEMSPQEVIDDLRAKGFAAVANDVAEIYGLETTGRKDPIPGYWPFLIP